MATEVKVSGGIGFLGMLFLIFMTLKLCNVIDWSWWLVCIPLYGPFALVVSLFLLGTILIGIANAFDRKGG